MALGVGPPGPQVSLTRVSPKAEHTTSARPDDPKGSAEACNQTNLAGVSIRVTKPKKRENIYSDIYSAFRYRYESTKNIYIYIYIYMYF